MARRLFVLGVSAALAACATGSKDGVPDHGSGGSAGIASGGAADGASGSSGAAGTTGSGGSGGGFEGGFDAGTDAGFDPDAACATATEDAQVETLPVDIIWMVDNSVSMKPAIDQVTQGLNDFAALIASKSLDYRVIMLSMRSKTNPVPVTGGTRYAVCIPQPLAGDANCGNGTRFFQSSIDMLSTQPLEQFLGTLAQTTGYLPADAKGGEPWKQWLRPEATKTIVVVSDDNSRLTASQFETFAGGTDPFNSTKLGAGILDPSWNGLFDGYVFDGLYGWGSDTDPSVTCKYPDNSTPPHSGATYTDLVTKTGGVRAKICDGAAAWGPFFDAVAQAVSKASKISCEVAIPTPEGGTLDPGKINVALGDGTTQSLLYKVADVTKCDQTGGWYYDDPVSPTKVILCQASCDQAQQVVKTAGSASLGVQFGCSTIVK